MSVNENTAQGASEFPKLWLTRATEKLFSVIPADATSSVNMLSRPTLVRPTLPDTLAPPMIGTILPSGPKPIRRLKNRSTSPGLPTEN
ncbi:hypothetical protein NYZ99_09985 [Maribacter litopenaei]|uniref:Uncharacterized protein n=1 Tax=Maribacter litopenaei TaxID=2976127 RepID=A0ABY5YC90_9FLAO|nr:hypothetical protein [Maribacter litopenaei]UWX56478.1 hypothetical protein NYZ99_09985 [Maribacter litopenaei]